MEDCLEMQQQIASQYELIQKTFEDFENQINDNKILKEAKSSKRYIDSKYKKIMNIDCTLADDDEYIYDKLVNFYETQKVLLKIIIQHTIINSKLTGTLNKKKSPKKIISRTSMFDPLFFSNIKISEDDLFDSNISRIIRESLPSRSEFYTTRDTKLFFELYKEILSFLKECDINKHKLVKFLNILQIYSMDMGRVRGTYHIYDNMLKEFGFEKMSIYKKIYGLFIRLVAFKFKRFVKFDDIIFNLKGLYETWYIDILTEWKVLFPNDPLCESINSFLSKIDLYFPEFNDSDFIEEFMIFINKHYKDRLPYHDNDYKISEQYPFLWPHRFTLKDLDSRSTSMYSIF